MQAIIALLAKFGAPFGWLIQAILGFFWDKAHEQIQAEQKAAASHDENVAQAAQDMQKAKELKPDATEGETDEAIDDMFKHF